QDLPSTPALFLPLSRWQSSTGLNAQTLQTIDIYFRQLVGPVRAFHQYRQDAAQLGPDRAQTLHGLQLADLWQSAAKNCEQSLKALNSPTVLAFDPRITLTFSIMAMTLQKTIAGQTPCTLNNGQTQRPSLPQRRQERRQPLGEDVVLCIHDNETGEPVFFTAHAKNVSTGGLGLTRAPQLPHDTKLDVMFPTGRSMTAYVMWSTAETAGLKWVEPLAHSDLLLSGS
ncbi:MAG: PilZ domain-containing protein, partial [Pseudomonadota bacterium]